MTFMLLAFICGALILYLLLAGADFGAGIVELMARFDREGRPPEKTAYDALGPVWEANHIWLIIVVTILFVGFPHGYADLSITLHIPIFLALIGIIMRGSMFAFRHYDARKPEAKGETFGWIFDVNSLLSPFFLGVVAGALTCPLDLTGEPGFYERYIHSWLRPVPIASGVLTCTLCGCFGALFLSLEQKDSRERTRYADYANRSLEVTLAAAVLLVIAAARQLGLSTIHPFSTLLALGAIVVGTTLRLRHTQFQPWPTRLLAGVLSSLVVLSWAAAQYPWFHRWGTDTAPEGLMLMDAAAPANTLRSLVIVLILAGALIFPALGYLFAILKQPFQEEGRK